jgi:leader peptidase (prepilin peptidase) / N-methyltransferase
MPAIGNPDAGPTIRAASVAAASVALGGVLVLLAAIDLIHFRLPDRLTLPLLGAGLIVTTLIAPADLPWNLAAAAFGYGALASLNALYQRRRGHAGLGLGDAKLLAAAGAWVGPVGLPSVLLIGCAAALLLIAAQYVCGKTVTRTTKLPFGPFLGLGFWLTWLYGALL